MKKKPFQLQAQPGADLIRARSIVSARPYGSVFQESEGMRARGVVDLSDSPAYTDVQAQSPGFQQHQPLSHSSGSSQYVSNPLQTLDQTIHVYVERQKEFDAWLKGRNSPFYAAYVQARRYVKRRVFGVNEREVQLREIYDAQVENLAVINRCLGSLIHESSLTLNEIEDITGGLTYENESLTDFLRRSLPLLREKQREYEQVTRQVQSLQENDPDSPEFWRGVRGLVHVERDYEGVKYRRHIAGVRYKFSKAEFARCWAYEKILRSVIASTAVVKVSVESLGRNLYIRGKAVPTILELVEGNSRVLGLVDRATEASLAMDDQLAQGLTEMQSRLVEVERDVDVSGSDNAVVSNVIGYLRQVG